MSDTMYWPGEPLPDDAATLAAWLYDFAEHIEGSPYYAVTESQELRGVSRRLSTTVAALTAENERQAKSVRCRGREGARRVCRGRGAVRWLASASSRGKNPRRAPLLPRDDRMNRRDFLCRTSLVAAGAVTADQLALLDRLGWKRRFFSGFRPGTPKLYGDGIHDDTAALQAVFDGRDVFYAQSGSVIPGLGPITIKNGTFRLSDSLKTSRSDMAIMDCEFKGEEIPVSADCVLSFHAPSERVTFASNVIGFRPSPDELRREVGP